MEENFGQLKLITRSWLAGANMYKALRAVNLGLEWHDGIRKDGHTPEFTHQLSQIQDVRALQGIAPEDLQTIICTIALHDLSEDKRYDIRWVRAEFGDEVGTAVERMSKKFFGKTADKSDDSYFYEIGLNPYASIAKGTDRAHNQASMPGVFPVPKMHAYMEETEEHILPMLKEARKNFPHQEIAYTALRHRLREQIFLIRACLQLAAAPVG